MAFKKITDLTALASADANDMFEVADVSAALSKKVTAAGIAAAVVGSTPSNSITFTMLLSTLFGGQVASYANAGTAGGTFYYIDLKGMKLLWGKTASQAIGMGGGNWTVTLPGSFFSSIQSSIVTLDTIGTEPKQWCYVSAITNSTLTIGATSSTNGASQVNSVFIMGT
jgi:hypothetical protein